VDLVVDGVIFQKDPHGGIARMFREMLPRMCELDPALAVVLFTDGPLRGALPAHPRIVHRSLPGVRPTLRPHGWLRRTLYPLRRLLGSSWNRLRRSWLADLSGGIWHSTFYTFPERWGGPQVVTVYDLIPERYPWFYSDPLEEVGRQRKRRCILQADRVVCISQATRYLVESMYLAPPERLAVVYPAYSHVFRVQETGESELPGGSHAPFLLYVGNRGGPKNFSALLDAYAGWEKRDEISLVCVGAGWRPFETRKIVERGVDARVRLLQDVDDERLCRLYNQALGFVYPSLEEGFGIPLLEAMACGCPVVASRIPTTLEVAEEVPVYFEPGEDRHAVDSLRTALDRLSLEGRSPARRAAGLERARAFSWDRTAAGMLAVYRSVVGKTGAMVDR
jgi:glycosyltransferase involved in cell wall biosynthesis